MRVLIFGDVVGKPGRRALKEVLPSLRKERSVDIVLANVENLAHGKGVTKKTLDELLATGVDFCTSGNHIFDKEGKELVSDPGIPLLRPANFPQTEPGRGAAIVNVGKEKLLVLNLIGTTFFPEGDQYENPFVVADRILKEYTDQEAHGIVVDWHTEATSEKIALGWYLDGRVSAVFGTHTHVASDDLMILPQGTAYRSDLGMVGIRDGVLGVDREIIVHNFVHPDNTKSHRWPENGPVQIHGVLVEIDPKTRRAVTVENIDREVVV